MLTGRGKSYMKVLVIAEIHHQKLAPATLACCQAALQLADNYDLLIVGHDVADLAEQATSWSAAQTIHLADAPEYQHQLAENLSQLIVGLAEQYQSILAPASTFGKNLLPRVAALLDVTMLSDISEIVAADTFIRPIYAGNALAKVKLNAYKTVLTIRPTCFDKVATAGGSAIINKIDRVIAAERVQFIELQASVSERPELNSAKVVVSGGRALKSAENFKLIEQLADKLQAAVGASRAAVDAGFVPNDYQVGQTGKVVAPDLYIAVGISGAIQHLAGMKDSKIIVAINKDPEAPIFKVADYGLVGDLFEILPELTAALPD